METQPEKTCEVNRFVANDKLVQTVLAERKTQQRRNGVYGYVGEEIELEGRKLKITRLERQSLGAMTYEDAVEEGFPSLEAYKQMILNMHKNMQWIETALVWLREFQM